jgi:hypothetical protein
MPMQKLLKSQRQRHHLPLKRVGHFASSVSKRVFAIVEGVYYDISSSKRVEDANIYFSIFVPQEKNVLLDLLMARTVTGESPPRRARSRSQSPSKLVGTSTLGKANNNSRRKSSVQPSDKAVKVRRKSVAAQIVKLQNKNDKSEGTPYALYHGFTAHIYNIYIQGDTKEVTDVSTTTVGTREAHAGRSIPL